VSLLLLYVHATLEQGGGQRYYPRIARPKDDLMEEVYLLLMWELLDDI